MTGTATIPYLRYPFIWIFDESMQTVVDCKLHPKCRKIPKIVSFKGFVYGKYASSYYYFLKNALLNGEVPIGVPDICDVSVDRLSILEMLFYRKECTQVYTDVIIRADVSVLCYSGEVRKITRDYRIRGYYDFDSKRNKLFQYIMPYSRKDDLDCMPLNEYLVPVMRYDSLDLYADKFRSEYGIPTTNGYTMDYEKIAENIGLKIIYARLSPDCSVHGRIYLKRRKVTLYKKDGTPYQKYVPAYTIIIDADLNAKDKQAAINAIFHEFTHFAFHSLFILFQQQYADELKHFNNPMDIDNIPMSPEDRKLVYDVEWQAERLAPRIQMPDYAFMDTIDELLEKYSGEDYAFEQYEKVIKEVSQLYTTSKQATINRMVELGYEQARGILVYVDDRYIPDHSWNRKILPYQTYTVQKQDLISLMKKNSRLTALLQYKIYIYIEGHICLNDEQYIVRQNGKKELTPYARNHIDECCILLKMQHRDNEYSYNAGLLSNIDKRNMKTVELGVDELNDIMDEVQFYDEIPRGLPEEFLETIAQHMRTLNMSPNQLADTSTIKLDRLKNILSNRVKHITLEDVVAIGLGLGLQPEQIFDLVDKSPVKFERCTRHKIIFVMIRRCYKYTVHTFNLALAAFNEDPLTVC